MESEVFRRLLDQIKSQPERELWEKWGAHCAAIGFQRFCVDGAGGQYFAKSLRILFALKDPNKRTGVAMQAQIAKGPERMWHAVARWGAIVYEGLDPVGAATVPRISHDLNYIAAINLKKETRESTSNDEELNSAACRDREWLLEQIRVLKPDVIIACGTQIPITWLLGRETPPVGQSISHPYRSADNGPWVIPFRHPAKSPRPVDDRLRESVRLLKAQMEPSN